LAITSRNNSKWIIQLKSSQFRYAFTYIVVTFLVLLFLNIYSFETSKTLFFTGKETALLERCDLAATRISQLDKVNRQNISGAVLQIGNTKTSPLLVTDLNGRLIYDSNNTADINIQYLSFPEVLKALNGKKAFSGTYEKGALQSRAAVPIYASNRLIGCVYIIDNDAQQGALILSLQENTLFISIFLELAVIVFSLIFSNTYSKRLRKISESMRTIREGNYSRGVDMGGNDELTVLGEEFNDLISRLQTSEQKRNNFVSDASHELKTPLASIKLLSDSILQNDMDIATIREFVGDIGNEADRLNRMSEKLLSLSRIESQTDSDCEIIYMAPTVERVMRMLKKQAEQKNISFCSDLTNDSTILILQDDLYQIVFNLVENAIKYNVPGGKVCLTLTRQEDNAVLKVQDTGVGIDEDAQTHIFERFFRVDKARSRNSGGSGLGLSIVRNMVERNQGEIRVESAVGVGSTFMLSFPVFETEEV